jgi:hypothetical protein
MIASIPSVKSAHDFFMGAGFVFGVVPMYLNLQRGLLPISVLSCAHVFCSRDIKVYLVLSAFTSWPFSLVATYKASLFFYNMYVFVQ